MYVLPFGRRSVCACPLFGLVVVLFCPPLSLSLLVYLPPRLHILPLGFCFLVFCVLSRPPLVFVSWVRWLVCVCLSFERRPNVAVTRFWLAPPLPFSSRRRSYCIVRCLVVLSSVVVLVCVLRHLVFFFCCCLLCCVPMSWGWRSRGVVVLCLRLSMSSLSAVLLHRREVPPHMSFLLLSLCLFVLLLLVGWSGVCGARAHHA